MSVETTDADNLRGAIFETSSGKSLRIPLHGSHKRLADSPKLRSSTPSSPATRETPSVASLRSRKFQYRKKGFSPLFVPQKKSIEH